MTPKHVAKRVAVIAEWVRRGSWDDKAHEREDALHRSVLTAIANGAAEPAALAREALKTTELEFCRWYS